MTSPIEKMLSALHKVRQRQTGQWSACCPAHDDKGPSLSVRETPDGAVLLHCFAGCEVPEIVAAVGLQLHELFPPPERPSGAPKRLPKLLTAYQGLAILEDEAMFLAVLAADIAKGAQPTEAERQRALKAAGRIAFVRKEVMT